jgi:hypothetical protein
MSSNGLKSFGSWRKVKDESGSDYYYDEDTGTSSWYPPLLHQQMTDGNNGSNGGKGEWGLMDGLPPNDEQFQRNLTTGEVSWQMNESATKHTLAHSRVEAEGDDTSAYSSEANVFNEDTLFSSTSKGGVAILAVSSPRESEQKRESGSMRGLEVSKILDPTCSTSHPGKRPGGVVGDYQMGIAATQKVYQNAYRSLKTLDTKEQMRNDAQFEQRSREKWIARFRAQAAGIDAEHGLDDDGLGNDLDGSDGMPLASATAAAGTASGGRTARNSFVNGGTSDAKASADLKENFDLLGSKAIVVRQAYPWTMLVDVKSDNVIYRNETDGSYQVDVPNVFREKVETRTLSLDEELRRFFPEDEVQVDAGNGKGTAETTEYLGQTFRSELESRAQVQAERDAAQAAREIVPELTREFRHNIVETSSSQPPVITTKSHRQLEANSGDDSDSTSDATQGDGVLRPRSRAQRSVFSKRPIDFVNWVHQQEERGQSIYPAFYNIGPNFQPGPQPTKVALGGTCNAFTDTLTLLDRLRRMAVTGQSILQNGKEKNRLTSPGSGSGSRDPAGSYPQAFTSSDSLAYSMDMSLARDVARAGNGKGGFNTSAVGSVLGGLDTMSITGAADLTLNLTFDNPGSPATSPSTTQPPGSAFYAKTRGNTAAAANTTSSHQVAALEAFSAMDPSVPYSTSSRSRAVLPPRPVSASARSGRPVPGASSSRARPGSALAGGGNGSSSSSSRAHAPRERALSPLRHDGAKVKARNAASASAYGDEDAHEASHVHTNSDYNNNNNNTSQRIWSMDVLAHGSSAMGKEGLIDAHEAGRVDAAMQLRMQEEVVKLRRLEQEKRDFVVGVVRPGTPGAKNTRPPSPMRQRQQEQRQQERKIQSTYSWPKLAVALAAQNQEMRDSPLLSMAGALPTNQDLRSKIAHERMAQAETDRIAGVAQERAARGLAIEAVADDAGALREASYKMALQTVRLHSHFYKPTTAHTLPALLHIPLSLSLAMYIYNIYIDHFRLFRGNSMRLCFDIAVASPFPSPPPSIAL